MTNILNGDLDRQSRHPRSGSIAMRSDAERVAAMCLSMIFSENRFALFRITLELHGTDAFVQCRIADCIPPGFHYLKLQLMSAATAPGVANDGSPQNGRLLFCNPVWEKTE
jgi:hypothetical protein